MYREENRAPNENSYMVISEMILGGIALELFMKGIIRSNSPTANLKSYGHNLKKMYDSLSDDIKSHIYNDVRETYAMNGSILHDTTHLESLIDMHKDTFIIFRYLFEDDYYAKMTNHSPLFIYAITVCLYNYVASHKDDFV